MQVNCGEELGFALGEFDLGSARFTGARGGNCLLLIRSMLQHSDRAGKYMPVHFRWSSSWHCGRRGCALDADDCPTTDLYPAGIFTGLTAKLVGLFYLGGALSRRSSVANSARMLPLRGLRNVCLSDSTIRSASDRGEVRGVSS